MTIPQTEHIPFAFCVTSGPVAGRAGLEMIWGVAKLPASGCPQYIQEPLSLLHAPLSVALSLLNVIPLLQIRPH